MHNTQTVVIVCADESLVIMAFVMDVRVAEGTWEREGSDAEIEGEIAKSASAWPPEKLPIREWHRVAANSIPTDRSNRDSWRWRDGAILTG